MSTCFVQANFIQLSPQWVQPCPNTGLSLLPNFAQHIKVDRGPTLGDEMLSVYNQSMIFTGGTYIITPDIAMILINVGSAVTINLPSVGSWTRDPFDMVQDGFSGGIIIKDLFGQAGTFNITVIPDGTDKIDGSSSALISTNFGSLQLFPLNDLSGWFKG